MRENYESRNKRKFRWFDIYINIYNLKIFINLISIFQEQRHDESDQEYIARLKLRIIEKDKKLTEKDDELIEKVKKLNEKDELLIENDKIIKKQKLDATETNLHLLIMSDKLNNFIKLKINPSLYESISISNETYEIISEIVYNFNNQGKVIEQSGSIDKLNSVHHIWKQIIHYLQEDDPKLTPTRRVLYEWGILHPIDASRQSIDLTFIPIENSYLNWQNYQGGIELKITHPSKTSENNIPSDKKEKSGGAINVNGIPQAMNHAAMCVYSRWKANGCKGNHKAYCCSADSTGFYVVTVVLIENNDIEVEVTDFFPLPVRSQETCLNSLKLLKALLFSPMSKLNDLITNIDHSPTNISGRSFNNSSTETWYFQSVLGVGGYSTVFSELDSAYVIKFPKESNVKNPLKNEVNVLNILNKSIEAKYFPKVIDTLYDNTTNEISALKLSPRGYDISTLLNDKLLLTRNDNISKDFIRAIGPEIVTALKIAHDCNICHADVRRDNILVVLSADDYKRVNESDDFKEELVKVDISTCSFLLNDWGNALLSQSKNNLKDDNKKKDLKGLVDALNNIKILPDITPARAEVDKKTACLRRREPGIISPEDIKSLEGAISRIDYNQIHDILLNIK